MIACFQLNRPEPLGILEIYIVVSMHMSWEEELQELTERGELAEAMGGTEKVARQHHFGKLTIRQRIDAIVDPGSFH